MNEIQILGNLRIWTIFRAPAAREEKIIIFALRNHHFVFKTPQKFSPAARENIYILPSEMMVLCSKIPQKSSLRREFPPYKSRFCVQKPHFFFRAYSAFSPNLTPQRFSSCGIGFANTWIQKKLRKTSILGVDIDGEWCPSHSYDNPTSQTGFQRDFLVRAYLSSSGSV